METDKRYTVEEKVSVTGVKGQQRLASQLADMFVGHLFMLTLLVVYYTLYSILSIVTAFQLSTGRLYILVVILAWLPWTLLATVIEHKFQASLGQLMFKQTTIYKPSTLWRCWLRQCLKYLPYLFILLAFLSVWQTGPTIWQLLLLLFAFIDVVSVWLMIVKRQDNRHWIDLLVSSQVIKKESHIV